MSQTYRGRLAPSPTGFLHIGHARTFWIAYERALQAGGVLILRNEDLDPQRSKPQFASAMLEDLRWLGIRWQEGPDCGGPFGPYIQSARGDIYKDAFEKLRAAGWVYPCICSRQDVMRALHAPHAGDDGGINNEIAPFARKPRIRRGNRPAFSLAPAHGAIVGVSRRHLSPRRGGKSWDGGST